MLRQLKRMASFGLVICMTLLMVMTAFADEQIASGTFSGLSIDSDGSVSWSLSDVPEGREVELYRVSLARLNNGDWRENYRTVTVKDESDYNISFTSTGVYKFRVRARYYGGEWTNWSDYSAEVTVTRDDLDYGSWDGGGLDPALDIVYRNNRYGNYGPGYVNGLGGSSSNYGPGVSDGSIINRTEGWIQDNNGWWYRFYDGSYPKNGWYYIEDKWYYFNENGYRVTGWIWYDNNWYYAVPEGYKGVGWQFVNEKWYYLNETGVMQTGYLTLDGKTYYLDGTGARVENGYSPERHYFGADGVMMF